ncbi:hypothetical protein BDW62DRAFT_178786 [Aspergillus aurantiobrunneus]
METQPCTVQRDRSMTVLESLRSCVIRLNATTIRWSISFLVMVPFLQPRMMSGKLLYISNLMQVIMEWSSSSLTLAQILRSLI